MTDKKSLKKKDKKRTEPVAIQTPKFNLLNWLLLVIAVIIIVLGFVFLSKGSITLAPILLVLGYCVVVPLALILRPKSKPSGNDA
jgi:cyanate permease